MDKIKAKRLAIVILLIVVAVIMRLKFKYPHHPDHFTWGEYTNAIIEYGYAPWVLHPVSLFGYYPLSIPSGFEFFFSYLSVITGLELPTLFFYSSIFIGLFGGLSVYLMMRHWASFETSILSSFVLLTMAFYARVTSNTGSTRILNIVFYPLFVLLLFKFYESWVHGDKFDMKYLIMAGLLFIMMSLIHRLSQLSVILAVSFIIAIFLHHWEDLLERFKKTTVYSKRKKFYEESRLHIVIDVLVLFILLVGYAFIKAKLVYLGVVLITGLYYLIFNFRRKRNLHLVFIDFMVYIGVFVLGKAGDLLFRGRLLHHLEKLVPLWQNYQIWVIIVGSLLIGIGIVLVYIIGKLKLLGKLIRALENIVDKMFIFFETNPDRAISYGLLIILVLFTFSAFTTGGFLNIDTSHYETSFLIEGDSPLIILVNFLFNLNNNLTPLIWFSIFGILSLFLSHHKSVYHYFFIIVAIFFSQFIFDWEYVRLFMNHIYAIFTALGISAVVKFVVKLKPRLKKYGTILLIVVLLIHFIGVNVFMGREVLEEVGLSKSIPRVSAEQYIEAGNYFEIPKQETIFTTKNLIRHQEIAFYGSLYDATITTSIFTSGKQYEITSLTFDELFNDLRQGQKLRQLYTLNDWITPGLYYYGRHIAYLTGRPITDRVSRQIIDEYYLRFVVDSNIISDPYLYYSDIKELKNRIYSSSQLDIYDLEKGRT